MRAGSRALALATICAVLAALLALPVAAHAELVKSTPGPGDTVTDVPDELVAHFSQNLDGSRSSMQLRDAAGTTLSTGGKVPDEPRTMTMPLPDLAPGTYSVRWTTFSAEDNELARGRYEFTVVADASPTPTSTPTRTPQPSAEPSGAASPGASAEPTAEPSVPASATPSASPSPAASAVSPPPTAPADDPTSILIVLIVAATIVGVIAVRLIRVRPA